MIPMPVYPPPNPGFLQTGGDNPHINKVPVPPARPLHPAHMATATATAQEPVQHISSAVHSKTGGEQAAGDSTEGERIVKLH